MHWYWNTKKLLFEFEAELLVVQALASRKYGRPVLEAVSGIPVYGRGKTSRVADGELGANECWLIGDIRHH